MIPVHWQERLAGCALEPVTLGESGAAVFRVRRPDQSLLYLKLASGYEGEELAGESARLRWLAGRVCVPGVIDEMSDGGSHGLLMSAMQGEPAHLAPVARASAVVTAYAAALKALHAVPIADCPFDRRLAVQLRAARRRTEAGLVDESDFDACRLGRRAIDLLGEAERDAPASEDLVLTHGDACLPNAMFDGARFTGFVDCGRFGVADRYQDLALAVRSIRCNWMDESLVAQFLFAYGAAQPDETRLAYYTLFDEFF